MVRLNGAISYTPPIGQPRRSRLKDLQRENDTTRVAGVAKTDVPNLLSSSSPSFCQGHVQVVVSETASGKYYTSLV